MKNRAKAFTLIELIIVLAIFGILAGVVGPMIMGALRGETMIGADGQEKAVGLMQKHVESLYGWSDVRVECGTYDTDGNGYVRCTAVGRDPETREQKSIEKECGAVLSLSQNCVAIRHGNQRW